MQVPKSGTPRRHSGAAKLTMSSYMSAKAAPPGPRRDACRAHGNDSTLPHQPPVAPRRDTSHGSRREDHAVAEYLAARSVERAVANDPVTAAQRFVAPARAVSEMPALTTEATDRLLDYAAWKEATGATEYDPRWEVRERTVEAPLPRDLLEHPREVIDAETRSAAASEARANAEVKLAVNKSSRWC
jgi:hypothetical protein